MCECSKILSDQEIKNNEYVHIDVQFSFHEVDIHLHRLITLFTT